MRMQPHLARRFMIGVAAWGFTVYIWWTWGFWEAWGGIGMLAHLVYDVPLQWPGAILSTVAAIALGLAEAYFTWRNHE